MVLDLIKRDYDNKNHKQIIRASNILIVGTYDGPQNFVCLSVIINHHINKIES